MNIEAVLTRADVIWFDDMVKGMRVVKSRNAEAPLTKNEQAMICLMWAAQGVQIPIIFYTDMKGDKDGNKKMYKL